MRGTRIALIGAAAGGLVAFAFAACVGDPPADLPPVPDTGSGTDAPTTNDGGGDSGCATGDLSCDPKSCGAAGHDCLGGPCKSGGCQPLVLTEDQVNPTSIVVDGTTVYWTNAGSELPCKSTTDGSLNKVENTGGTATALLQNLACPNSVVVSGVNAYVSCLGTAAGGNGDDGSILRVAKAGGAPANVYAPTKAPREMLLGGTVLFWHVAQNRQDLLRGDINGGAQTLVADTPSGLLSMTLDGARIYWSTPGDDGGISAADWTYDLDAGTGDGGGEVLSSPQKEPFALSVSRDGNYLFFVERTGDEVKRMTLATKAVEGFATTQSPNSDLIVDGTHVYWWSSPGDVGTLYRIALADPVRKVETVASYPGSGRLAADDKSIYVAVRNTGGDTRKGRILRIAK